MSNVSSFIKLDYMTVKPYLTLKNMLIFLAVAVIMSISAGSSAVIMGIFIAYGALYITYPFAVAEKNNLDTLYATLSTGRSGMVKGRYAFALCVDIVTGALALGLSYVLLTLTGKEFIFMEAGASLVTILLAFIIIQSIQLPIYFKLGYTKAKMLAYLPFLVVPGVFVLFGTVVNNVGIMGGLSNAVDTVFKYPAFTAAACLCVCAGAVAISLRLSLRFYLKRDF